MNIKKKSLKLLAGAGALSISMFTANASATVIDFSFTGALQTFVVPTGVSLLHIDAWGAQGYSYSNSSAGGLGGLTSGDLHVTSNQVLYIFVGGQGGMVDAVNTPSGGGFNGGGNGVSWGGLSVAGGGGGMTDLRVGGTAFANTVLVSGGGGGATGNAPAAGGAGGGLIGESATAWAGYFGGTGGTQTAGGIGGGQFGQGGNGLAGNTGWVGGGGGGWYGGGASPAHFGGGGGSSHVGLEISNAQLLQGVRAGNGELRLSFEVSPVPEPASYGMLLAGLGLIGALARRKPRG